MRRYIINENCPKAPKHTRHHKIVRPKSPKTDRAFKKKKKKKKKKIYINRHIKSKEGATGSGWRSIVLIHFRRDLANGHYSLDSLGHLVCLDLFVHGFKVQIF